MLMGMARRPLGNGTLQFKAMVSPDPLMGPRGYPLLLASGETANGRDRLIDRQHPHDFFMELSGSVSQNIGREQQRLPLRRASRRAGLRAARVHAPRGDPRFAGSADHPPLARFHPHQLRRPDRRHRPRSDEARSQPLQRPRARPAPLEHRDRPAGFDRGPAVVEPHRGPWRCKGAGVISSTPNSSSPASTRNAGPRARCGRTRLPRAGSSPPRSPGAGSPPVATATMHSPRKPRSSMTNGRCSPAPRWPRTAS